MRQSAKIVLLALLVAILSSASGYAVNDRPWATIGTGALTGVYYNVGQAMKKTLNRFPADPEINLSVEETRGSLENLEAVTSGRFYFGIIQSDVQFKAWNGVNGSPWAGRPQKNLRAVFSLYTEAINLVVATRRGVQSPGDLKGKRIAISLGEPGSGDHVNAHEVLDAVGVDPGEDLSAVYVSPVDALYLFGRNRLDAFFFTAGHPAAMFHEVNGGKRRARFVTLNPEDEMLKRYPYYRRTVIPARYYPDMDNPTDVPTIGVKATVVASAETPDWMVYGLVKTIAENIDYLRTQLQIFEYLTRESALEDLAAPIHPGALKYYREIGMVP
jgi:hypothetical protein